MTGTSKIMTVTALPSAGAGAAFAASTQDNLWLSQPMWVLTIALVFLTIGLMTQTHINRGRLRRAGRLD